jgi:hypothetical protein
LYFCFLCHNKWTGQALDRTKIFSQHSLPNLTYLPNLPKLT